MSSRRADIHFLVLVRTLPLGLAPLLRCCAIPQRVDDESESRRLLSAAWIVEVVAGKRFAPLSEQASKSLLPDMSYHLVFGQISEPKAGERRVADEGEARENKLAIHADFYFAARFLKLPGIEAAPRQAAQVDAPVFG
jgi:hypothetical protein